MLTNRARLIGLAIITGLLFTIVMVPSVIAEGGKITMSFDLVDNTTFTPDIPPLGTTEAHGSGKIEINGHNLDNLKFKLKMAGEDLTPNTWYYLSVTVREGDAGGAVPVALAVAGMAKTDGAGDLEFTGDGVLPNVFESGATEWRIDQQIRLLGNGIKANCVECILVCAPTTLVKLNAAGDGLVKR